MSTDEVLTNQRSIIANQETIIGNQKRIEANQAKLDKALANQAVIVSNQQEILSNQAKLDTVLAQPGADISQPAGDPSAIWQVTIAGCQTQSEMRARRKGLRGPHEFKLTPFVIASRGLLDQ